MSQTATAPAALMRPDLALVHLTVTTACARHGISRSRLYILIRTGQIEARKLGRRTMIVASSIDAFFAGLPAVRRRMSTVAMEPAE